MTEQELDGGRIDSLPDEGLDAHDRRILGIIQSGFPLESRPYAAIGREVGLPEEEVFARVRDLKARKIIRRLGANFQSAKLGFRSTRSAAHPRHPRPARSRRLGHRLRPPPPGQRHGEQQDNSAEQPALARRSMGSRESGHGANRFPWEAER